VEEYFGDFLFDSFQPFFFYQDSEVEYRIPEFNAPKDVYVGKFL